jgi:hypothetical protein
MFSREEALENFWGVGSFTIAVSHDSQVPLITASGMSSSDLVGMVSVEGSCVRLLLGFVDKERELK